MVKTSGSIALIEKLDVMAFYRIAWENGVMRIERALAPTSFNLNNGAVDALQWHRISADKVTAAARSMLAELPAI